MFRDVSQNATLLTQTGVVSASTFSPQGSNWSSSFDGSSTYALGTSPAVGTTYTFETWFFLNSAITAGTAIIGAATTASAQWNVRFNSSTAIQVDSANISGQAFTVPTITPGVWHHLALVRNSSNQCTVFLDGVRSSTGAVSLSTAYNGPSTIGAHQSLANFNGYMSNLRLVNGTAVYDPTASTITVPTSALTAITNTNLLTFNDPYGKDGSASPITLTRTGTPKIAAFGPFGTTAFSPPTQGGSVYFDGSAKHYDITTSSAFGFGTGDFTIETWLYPTTVTSSVGQVLFDMRGGNAGSNAVPAPMVYLQANGTLTYYVLGANTIASSILVANTWNHIALVRVSGSTKLYLNGVAAATVYTDSNNYGTTNTLTIGWSARDSNSFVNGYMSNFRVVKGTGVYTGTFIPARQDLGAITNTTLLTFQGSTVVDASSSALTLTLTGAGTNGIPRTFKPFADAVADAQNGSLYLPLTGNASYLYTPSSAALAFGTGDFTIEAWIYRTRTGAIESIASNTTTTIADYNYFIFKVTAADKLRLGLRLDVGATTTVDGATSITANTWHHVAATRSGGTVRLFVDGVLDGTATIATNMTMQRPVLIGANIYQGSEDYFQGYISNFRILKGSAQYTAAFTPSLSPLTAITNTSLLLSCSTGVVTDASSNNFTISGVGTAILQNQNPFQTGIHSTYGSSYFTGASLGSYLTAPASAAYGLGTGNFTMEAWIYPLTTAQGTIFDLRAANGATPTVFRITNARTLDWYDGTTDWTSTATVQLNAWSHVAVARVGSSVSFYVNGVLSNSVTSSANLGSSNPLRIGANASVSGYDFNGYIYGARISKAAVYTGAFTPSVAPQPLASTTFLSSFADGTMVDLMRETSFIPVGTVTLNSSTKKFGDGAISMNGVGNYVYTPICEALGFGLGDFTLEGWLYCTASGLQPVFDMRDKGGAASQVKPFLYFNGTQLVYTVSNVNRITATSAIVANTWAHVAICRSGGSTRAFINGTQVGSTYVDTNDYGYNANLIIGTIADAVGSGSWPLVGTVDDVRITKGYGRYTANFTAPTGKLPTVGA
jgi:hypothetical protein